MFHVGILPGRPAAEVAELAALAEELGFAGIWVADSQSLFRDAFAALTLAAARTERIELATGVTNPVTRHPAVLAGAFATLQEQSGGRAVCGIGVGESAVQTLGLRPARLGELEAAARALRGLLAGEEGAWHGARSRMAWPVQPVPIVFASSAPRSLALAGRVADGALMQVGAEPAAVRWALGRVAEGEREAGRPPIRKLLRLACTVDRDRARAREQARAYASVAAGTVFANVPSELLPEGVREDIAAMKERYDYYEHGSRGAAHAGLVTDRILDSVAVAGTPDEAVPRLRELLETGVDGVVVPVVTDDPPATMRLLAEEVVARL